MPKDPSLKKILVIGSGPIIIGQACEFDYSGTQAIKVLKKEGIEVALVNSNPATIMTDPEYADRTYVEPLTPEVVTAMMWLYILPPTIISALVALVMWRFPLDETKQRELRRIIEERSVPGTAIGARLGHTMEIELDAPASAVKPAE